MGQADNQVKLRGWRIELEEIEAAALRCPGVAQAGVVPRRDEAGRVETLTLHVAPAGAFTGDALVGHLKGTLPRHMRPAEVVVGTRLPLTGTGKLDRLRLAEFDTRRRERSVRAASQPGDLWPDPLHRRIAAVLAREARIAGLRPDDSFAALGGDSLKALQAMLAIEKVFGVSCDPACLLGEGKLAEIVADIAAEADASTLTPN